MRSLVNDSSANISTETAIKWMGLKPLDFVDRIVCMAAESSKLSSFVSGGELGEGYSFLQLFQSGNNGGVVDNKRKRQVTFDDDECFDVNDNDYDECAGSVLDNRDNFNSSPPDDTFKPWSPSAVLFGTVGGYHGEHVSKQVQYLDAIVKSFEQLAVHPMQTWFIPSYNRVQFSFALDINELGVECVLKRALSQMMALMELVSKNTTMDVASKSTSQSNANSIIVSPPSNKWFISEKEKQSVFNSTLTSWLRQSENFVNPYPDDIVLDQLVRRLISLGCITTTDGSAVARQSLMDIALEKINVWLTNARSRKWRPSIEIAFDAKRPAMLLLEDSLRNFDETELRPVIGWDTEELFASLPDYSLPLSEWTWGNKKPSPRQFHPIQRKKVYNEPLQSCSKSAFTSIDSTTVPSLSSSSSGEVAVHGGLHSITEALDDLADDVEYKFSYEAV
jgi:hypothetical protein